MSIYAQGDISLNDTLTKVVICTFLMLATFCSYSQLKDHEFINFDDDLYITNNLNVQAGLSSESVLWAFTTSHPPYWHPVTWLSHIIDYQLYGLHPKGHYLTNLFLHISSVLMLFIVLLRMTGALWQSGFVAAMFALHPLNIESVAWIAERKNVLSTFFWLITVWAYIYYSEKPNFKRYGLVFFFFTLGLMSKPMLVTLPFVLLLLDYWPLGRWKLGQERGIDEVLDKKTTNRPEFLKLLLEKIPLLLLAIGLSIATFYFQNIAGAVKSLDIFPLQVRLANAIVSYFEYLGKMLWPSGLSILYPHPGNNLSTWQVILCGMALAGITIFSIRLIRKLPYFAVGWFWYLGTLIPVIGVVQVGGQAMADRFVYIPLIGIFIIVAWGLPELISKWRYKEKVLSVSSGIIIFTLLITTWEQVSHWKNSITIFRHTIRVTDTKHPSFAVIHNNFGVALFADRKNEEAISHFKMAIKLMPTDIKAHYNLGIALFAGQKNEEAIAHYKMAIKLQPNYTSAHYNLGNALFAVKKTEEAISHYKMAIELMPNLSNAHYNLGYALVQKGDMKEAAHHFRETLKLRPDLVAARDSLKFALLRSQELE
jgi:protein O-mannosyl-transferase